MIIAWIVVLDNICDCNFLPVGVTVNSRCRPKMNNTTALHLAATGGCQPILDLLLQNEADPLAVDLLGATPLHKAVEQQNIPGVKCLLSLYVCYVANVLNPYLYQIFLCVFFTDFKVPTKRLKSKIY